MQHVTNPTRQRAGDAPHTLDLVITFEKFISDIQHLNPLGMSDHCVLKSTCQLRNTSLTRYTSNNKNKLKLKLDRGDYNGYGEFLDIDWGII